MNKEDIDALAKLTVTILLWYMGGYIFGYTLIILLSKFINLPSGTTFMLYLSSLPLYGIALWLVITLGPWIFFLILLYKFFKRTILK